MEKENEKPAYNIPENLKIALERTGLAIEDIDPDNFADQFLATEAAQKKISALQKPAPDFNAFFEPFKQRFDMGDTEFESAEDLAEAIYNSLPDDDDDEEPEANQQAKDDFARKFRELQLQHEETLKKVNGFAAEKEEAEKAGMLKAMKQYRISESILQNPALSQAGRANPEAVRSGFEQYLKSAGIELQADQNMNMVPRKSDGTIYFKKGSSEPADLQYLTNQYLKEKQWLAETATNGTGNLAKLQTGNNTPAVPIPTSRMWGKLYSKN